MQYKNELENLLTKIRIHRVITDIIVLSLILLFIVKVLFIPTIDITSPDTVELNKEYIPTYEAHNFFHNYSDKVKVKNKVNTSREGNYEVTFALKYLFLNIKRKEIVSVEYHGIPELTLVGEETIRVCPTGTYEEPGYTAYDKEYGDITNKVKIYRNDNIILYYIKNKNSKEITKTRTIIYEDIEKPVLLLKGDLNIELTVGDSYQEPGYTVTDNCDNKLESNVTITGKVNTNKPGTYKLTYSITDSSDNTTNVTRTVKVKANDVTYSQNSQAENIIYLTFDDGPSSSTTPKLLDILKEEQVPATFFVINHSDTLNYLLLREKNEGHTVALHSYTHNYANIYTSDESFLEDLNLIHDKVYKVTGIDSRITRFPGGSSNTISSKYNEGIMTRLTQKLSELGYNYFDWNIDSNDAGNAQTKDDVYNNVISNLQVNRSNIILMHDFENNDKTLNAIKDIIKYGKENGYRFEKITPDTYPIRHNVNN